MNKNNFQPSSIPPIRCSCLNNVLDNMPEYIEKYCSLKGRKVDKVNFINFLYTTRLEDRYVETMGINIVFTVHSLKTAKYSSVEVLFCPFCGTKLKPHKLLNDVGT